MNPVLLATLRRHWPIFGAGLTLVLLLGLHALLFVPTTRRYARAVQSLGGMQALTDPDQGPAPMPPRVFALVSENAMNETAATERGASGQLTVMMLEDLSAIASRLGLSFSLSEPGPVTPMPKMVEVRVHLRMRGNYRDLVGFLHALDASGRLYGIERYAISDLGGEGLQLEVWVSRLVLKQPGAR